MHLSMLPMVQRACEARDKVIAQIAAIEQRGERRHSLLGGDPRLVVLIGGASLGEAMADLVRPVVLAHLRAQVRSIEQDLDAWGVEVER